MGAALPTVGLILMPLTETLPRSAHRKCPPLSRRGQRRGMAITSGAERVAVTEPHVEHAYALDVEHRISRAHATRLVRSSPADSIAIYARLHLRSLTSATRDAAIVAASSAPPVARTAIKTPSLCRLPNRSGTRSRASVVTEPARS